ncbi:MAG: DUF6491 family protein [Gammaproteobacteria bacterium]|nr:DUF6491 family protein [Gammaproteobacteria bacterium]
MTATILVGCATSAPDQDLDAEIREITGQDGRTCIENRQIKGFGEASEHTITIRGTGGRYYVLTMRGSCRHLRHSLDIALDPRDHELCGVRNDRIIVDGETCYVKSVFKFPGRDEAYLAIEDAEAAAESRAVREQ